MSERKGGIPAWQRVDYKPRIDDKEVQEPATQSEDSSTSTNGPNNSPNSNHFEPSKPALDATHGERSSSNNTSDTQVSQVPPISPSSPSTQSSAQQQHPSAPPRPPIITYPEHLAQPQKPPPLVTTSRLLNTAYIFAGAAAICYGLSTYLVEPMTESLNAARLDFHSHTQSKLDEFNKKLEAIVSVDPAQGVLKGRQAHSRDASVAMDDASEDSDPTELFHRDIGTQTTAEDLPEEGAPIEPDAPKSMAEAHQRQIERIRAGAKELASDDLSSETQTIHEVRTVTDMLREQLEGLAYPAASDGGSYGYEGAGFSNMNGTNGTAKKNNDEVAAMKQEIRGIKGSLLSARSFPAGGVPAGRRDLFPAS